jgi:hypothetical protein
VRQPPHDADHRQHARAAYAAHCLRPPNVLVSRVATATRLVPQAKAAHRFLFRTFLYRKTSHTLGPPFAKTPNHFAILKVDAVRFFNIVFSLKTMFTMKTIRTLLPRMQKWFLQHVV